MQAESLQDFFRVADHLLQLLIAVLRPHDLDQLDLVELMHANHPARAHARRARFRAEARTVSHVTNRKLRLLQDFLSMDVGDRRFGRRQEIEFAEGAVVQPLLHRVSLILEFWELPHARHAIAPDDERRRHLRVAVLREV